MKNKIILLLSIAVSLVVTLLLFRSRGHPGAETLPKTPVASSLLRDKTDQLNPKIVPGKEEQPAPVSDTYPLWKGGPSKGLNDPRWDVIRKREKLDAAWEGKMAIEFYGKVVDENNQAVPGATVSFSWTDLSPLGSTQRIVDTDRGGRFSLGGVKGKHLVVDITKEGYDISHVENRFGFNYSAFGDDQYYEPDAANPVLFHVHKKRASESLVYMEKEIKISVAKPVTVPLYTGTSMTIVLQANQHPSAGHWEALLNIDNGGVIPATEEFIVEAPLNGYQARLFVSPSTPKPPMWQLYQGGAFYIKAGANFGRLDIEMIPGKDWLRVKIWVNPMQGSRVVATNSSVQIKH